MEASAEVQGIRRLRGLKTALSVNIVVCCPHKNALEELRLYNYGAFIS
jgi:hypothetical protein